MWSWDEVVGSTVAWARAQQLGRDVAGLETRHAGSLLLMRASTLQRMLADRLKSIEPMASFPEAYAEIDGAGTEVATALAAHLDDATTTADQVVVRLDRLARLINLLPLPSGLDGVGIAANIDAAQSAASAAAEEMRARVGELRTEVDHASATVSLLVNTDVAQVRIGVDDVRAELNTLRSEIGRLTGSFEADFSNGQSGRQNEFDESMRSLTQQWEEARRAADAGEELASKARSQVFEDTQELLAERASSVLMELEGLREKALKLVGAIGRDGLTAGYVEWEKVEEKAASDLRSTSLKFGVASACSLVALLAVHLAWGDTDFDPTLTVAAAALPAAFGALATYTARESTKHRRNQVLARRTSLELASFGPFIAELDEDKQRQLTGMFTAVFFGQAGSNAQPGPAGEGDDAFRPMGQEILKRVSTWAADSASKSPS